MNFIQFIQTRVFLKQFILSVVITAAAITLVLSTLKLYTHHGESFLVPALIGLTPDQIEQLETIENFEIIIVDSVFDSRLPRGSVIIQDPLPGSGVKRNRKIYLTTIAVLPEQVSMPNLVDLTLRQASATLETYGLVLGNVNYVPDIAANAVLGQFYKSREITPGTSVLKGSVISLKVGQNMGGGRYQVPFLLGKLQSEANQLLQQNYLQVGDETFENDADPSTARVYSQSPSYVRGLMMNAGQQVSLVYRDPEVFDFDAYLDLMSADTLNVEQDSVY
ncbi:MAG: PASTA domain-containing protein [Bacteroidales bacterium]|nr:PASTA domain-containing protein [Bacteroidales bacterium]